ncbi:APC family permease, partial [Acinetobacter baumannii]
KLLLLSGSTTILTIFYVLGVYIGRRSGRTGARYRTPLFPLIPLLGVGIVIGEAVVLWLDAETGRKSLFICAGAYLLAFCYYRFVLMRRP